MPGKVGNFQGKNVLIMSGIFLFILHQEVLIHGAGVYFAQNNLKLTIIIFETSRIYHQGFSTIELNFF